MEVIGQQDIWTFSGTNPELQKMTCTAIRGAQAHPVSTYMELAKKIAALQFRNRDFVLMFRGQKRDYLNKSRNSSIKAGLMRPPTLHKEIPIALVRDRLARLKQAEAELVRHYGSVDHDGLKRLKRYHIIRWSILQHYEICDTPLLDVTHSLRIAASFASEGAEDEAYLFVLGVPNLSGAITASAEAGLQIVRLASVCPPVAVRPHLQEGYLLGEYPDFSSIEQKENYKQFEMDFGRRLIAKFRFDPTHFWSKSDHFPRVPKSALYPAETHDPMCDLAEAVKAAIGPVPA